ncbi:hypothetical protein CKO27_12925 [Thiocystis violacea]|nr:hypothetical protein [Thiocystis violacea]
MFQFLRTQPSPINPRRGVQLHPRSARPSSGPVQRRSWRDVSAVEVFEVDRTPSGYPLFQVGFWINPEHLEVLTDAQDNPVQFSLLSEAMLTLRRLGWYGEVECTQIPY